LEPGSFEDSNAFPHSSGQVDPMLDRIPIRKTALTAGTPKGTLHIPGGNGWGPTGQWIGYKGTSSPETIDFPMKYGIYWGFPVPIFP